MQSSFIGKRRNAERHTFLGRCFLVQVNDALIGLAAPLGASLMAVIEPGSKCTTCHTSVGENSMPHISGRRSMMRVFSLATSNFYSAHLVPWLTLVALLATLEATG